MWRLVYLRDWVRSLPDPVIDWYLRRVRQWLSDNAKREDLP